VCGFSTISGEVENRVSNTSYGVDAEYYFPRGTVTARFSRTSTEDGGQRFGGVNQYGGQAALYPNTEWRLTAGYALTPGAAGTNTVTVAAEYQPAWLGNQLSAGLTYQRLSADYLNAYQLRLTITYYIGAQPDLLTRDRYFR
jgi:hypothetical protein